jgi:hypothetical protein
MSIRAKSLRPLVKALAFGMTPQKNNFNWCALPSLAQLDGGCSLYNY